jgi:hypothetical protein
MNVTNILTSISVNLDRSEILKVVKKAKKNDNKYMSHNVQAQCVMRTSGNIGMIKCQRCGC